MKSGSDNFRDSAVLDLIKVFKKSGITTYIYEPLLENNFFEGCQVIDSLQNFGKKSEIILANRIDSQISVFEHKIFTRDIYQIN